MSRKASLLGIAAALVLVVAAVVPAGAAITGTSHEVGSVMAIAGACSACHIPHGAAGARLWPISPSPATGKVGIVSQLCGSCHTNFGAYQTNTTAAHSDCNVYGAASHGTLMHTPAANLPWGTDLAASGFPYTDCAVNMECTSCHNVHDDTNRPFLRANINNLCAYCHTLRHYSDGTEHSGSANAGTAALGWGALRSGDNNVGSHPVGSDVTGDVSGDPSQIFLPTNMKVPYAGRDQWMLAGHLTGGATGGVTCVTCHAVHGIATDVDFTGTGGPTATLAPNANFLAVYQATGGGVAWSRNRTVANGQGAFNAFCEACHGRDSGGAVSNPPGFTSTYAVNPGGAGKYSHPIDTYPASRDWGVVGFGNALNVDGVTAPYWPVGGGMGTVTNVSPIPICESCHLPHPRAEWNAGTNSRADVDNVNLPTRAYILRSDKAAFCAKCHTTSIANHHPSQKTYNSVGVAYLAGVTGAADTLTCATCHSSSGAHNWSGPAAVGLATGWKPVDNGRNAADNAAYMYNADTSRSCIDCHYAMDGDATTKSPTMGTSATVSLEGDFQTVAAATNHGTHYVGLMHTTTDNAWFGAGAFQFWTPATGNWRTQLSGSLLAADAYSRFGGSQAGEKVLVCESCHNVKPAWNVGSHLLLAAYNEGKNGDDNTATAGDTNGRDIFCEACHGVPAGTHQLTGQIVTRTGLALNANAGGTTPNRTWIRDTILGTGATWNKTTNHVSCDSCHQPHDANPKSYTFILDALLDNVGTPTATSTASSISGNYAAAQVTATQAARGGDYTQFCNQCHLY